MKSQRFSRAILGVAIATVVILSIPLVAMQFTSEVNWSLSDFVIMGAILFGTGTALVALLRQSTHLAYKIGVAVGLGTTFFMIWANLAVGLIGSGPHAGNLMFMGVFAVCAVGIIRSHFKAMGMSRAMYASALSVIVVGVIALLAGMDKYHASSVGEILAVTGFFTVLYAVAGYAFQFAAHDQTPATSSN